MKVEINPSVIDGEEYYTVTQAAAILGMTYPQVYKYIKTGGPFGKLPAVDMLNRVLVNKKDVEKLIVAKNEKGKLCKN
jgi:excisionase family DNA binding protein